MKIFSIILFCSIVSFKAAAQDTVAHNKLPAYISRKVKLVMSVADFDLRKEYIYLYMGNFYPNQKFTVIVKRNDGKKHIKLNKDIILGRVMVAITGYISTFDGEPDTTKNYDDAAIKKEFERGRPMILMMTNQPGMMYRKYIPRTEPIDLKGKLVMLVTSQKQIGATYQIPPLSPNDFPAVLNYNDY